MCYLSILITSVLNFASGRLLASISFSSFCGVVFCSSIWDTFFCCLIVTASLRLFLRMREISYMSQLSQVA